VALLVLSSLGVLAAAVELGSVLREVEAGRRVSVR
jgi:hypothetical protein